MLKRVAVLVVVPLALSACSYSVKLPTEGLVETSSKPAATATSSELPDDAMQVSITQTNNSFTKTKYWSVIAYPEFAVVSGPAAAQGIVSDISARITELTDGFTQQAENCYDPTVQNSSLNVTARPDYVSQHLYVVQLEIAQYFCGGAHGDEGRARRERLGRLGRRLGLLALGRGPGLDPGGGDGDGKALQADHLAHQLLRPEGCTNRKLSKRLQQDAKDNQVPARGHENEGRENGEQAGDHRHVAQCGVNHVGHGQAHRPGHQLSGNHGRGGGDLHDHPHGEPDEDLLKDHCPNTQPDYGKLLESGHKKAKLRAHSDFYWNKACNEWALSFWDQFDIMCESKGKNLASFALYEHSKTITS